MFSLCSYANLWRWQSHSKEKVIALFVKMFFLSKNIYIKLTLFFYTWYDLKMNQIKNVPQIKHFCTINIIHLTFIKTGCSPIKIPNSSITGKDVRHECKNTLMFFEESCWGNQHSTSNIEHLHPLSNHQICHQFAVEEFWLETPFDNIFINKYKSNYFRFFDI